MTTPTARPTGQTPWAQPEGNAATPQWRWPLEGTPRVLREFAPPSAPWLAGHRGVDLAAVPGQSVVATGQGTVLYAGPVGGRAVVSIRHPNGLRTTYLPLEASVRPGQPVSSGTPIGRVTDHPGHCPVTCLHWGLLRGQTYLNPLVLLGLGRVRLLPHWTAPP
ncbi:murein hydrolase activator EnvC family protein [Sinosporangium album]|uniref:murein hydrolase activator EnvC family protein n=1 Tax=Sinosporangium album TaxID=504805 RepID=UPI001C40B52B|nr:M23 family metallopeptidase [Sinosporangium album]